ncbi:MAG: hypothetical protein GY937_21420 [bacterium]|nr:hypothetical protein [bacterium]
MTRHAEAAPWDKLLLPPCPGCGTSLPSDDPMDWHLDARERGWHWSCAAKVLAGWPERPEVVEPEGPDA